jgi:hypothetical protein
MSGLGTDRLLPDSNLCRVIGHPQATNAHRVMCDGIEVGSFGLQIYPVIADFGPGASI